MQDKSVEMSYALEQWRFTLYQTRKYLTDPK